MAAMLLGDFEAEVVKVEPPGGDRMKDHPGYLAFNRNKQVLTLDLDTPEGLAAARELIAGADVALFSDPPGRLEALGLDAATLTAAHPGLVHAWMPPYGERGDWSRIPPHHSLLSALSGVAFRQGGLRRPAGAPGPAAALVRPGRHGRVGDRRGAPGAQPQRPGPGGDRQRPARRLRGRRAGARARGRRRCRAASRWGPRPATGSTAAPTASGSSWARCSPTST